jgi:PIN domain nuclease of toxin-antitoxin system
MNYLLDTHTFLWTVFAPDKLSPTAKTIIRDPGNLVCLSTISFWEISLKYALGKLELVNCVPDELPQVALAMHLQFIAPDAAEAASFHRLPRLSHKDPFDRMLVWQAIRQRLYLVSRDSRFADYQSFGLRVVW